MSDAFDLSQAQIVGGAPDVRTWKPTATITQLSMGFTGVAVQFDRQAVWPDVVPPGWDGPLQFTLWLFVQRNGVWSGAGIVEFWRDRPSSGPYNRDLFPHLAAHLQKEWSADAGWIVDPPIQDGESVGFMVTAGDQRKKDVHVVAERSNIVVVPVQDVGTFKFTEQPPPPNDPPPVPPVQPPEPPPGIGLIDQFVARLDKIEAAVVSNARELATVKAQLARGFSNKYLGPILPR